ncbi:MAG: DNA-binding protein [Ignavibacteriales bacterium]|nr:MAG: DNA-binding protein [Ignavibacteriales bacterium]
MKIGILGSGIVAQQLGKAFINEGYEVKLGTRDNAKLSGWVKEAGTKASAGSFEEAAKFGEIVVLAAKGSAAAKIIESAGKDNLKSKVVIDTTNPLTDSPPENGVLHFFTSLDESLMEQLQKKFPEIKFVKAFNTIGNAVMYKPSFKDGTPTMFICGNEDDAKKSISEILVSFGWEVEDLGKVEAARAIEPLCILWCINGFLKNEWTNAFKLLKK